ncbi:MAG: TIM barrel protein [Nitrospiraceae bacterium]|nr:TIM barrel protein [Nitrospiraceae bacterium]
MFKLGAFTDEISQDLERSCVVCGEFGVTGAEIRGVWDTPCQELTDAQVRDIGRIVADHGMVVCSVGSPFGKCELDSPEEVAKHMDILRRCADIGLELDCTMIRGFAFWGHGSREKPWDRMLRAFEPVPGILEEKGVVLGLENEAACYVGTAQHTRHFLDLLQCDRVKALWDPANHVQDPDGRDVPSFPDGYAVIKDDLVHVHVKDAAPTPDGKMPNVFMGEGICEWKRQFQALKDDGFEGYCSLETHVNPEKFPDDLAARYGKYLTGEGREGASKVCLAWIRDVVEELT